MVYDGDGLRLVGDGVAALWSCSAWLIVVSG